MMMIVLLIRKSQHVVEVHESPANSWCFDSTDPILHIMSQDTPSPLYSPSMGEYL